MRTPSYSSDMREHESVRRSRSKMEYVGAKTVCADRCFVIYTDVTQLGWAERNENTTDSGHVRKNPHRCPAVKCAFVFDMIFVCFVERTHDPVRRTICDYLFIYYFSFENSLLVYVDLYGLESGVRQVKCW